MSEARFSELLRATAARGGTRGADCPDEASLAGYVDGGLGGSERSRIEGHLASCDACLAEVGFLSRAAETSLPRRAPADLVRRARRLVPRATPPRPVSVPSSWRWAAVAAGLLLVTSVVLWNLPQTGLGDATTETRLVDPDGLGPTILSPVEGATLSGGAVRVRWTVPSPSRFYEVRIVDADGTVIWRGRTEATEIVVPHDAGLVAGEKYFVRVSAHLTGDKTIRSRHVGFRIGPEPPL